MLQTREVLSVVCIFVTVVRRDDHVNLAVAFGRLNWVRTCWSSCRCLCRSIAAMSCGSSAFNRFPQMRSAACLLSEGVAGDFGAPPCAVHQRDFQGRAENKVGSVCQRLNSFASCPRERSGQDRNSAPGAGSRVGSAASSTGISTQRDKRENVEGLEGRDHPHFRGSV